MCSKFVPSVLHHVHVQYYLQEDVWSCVLEMTRYTYEEMIFSPFFPNLVNYISSYKLCHAYTTLPLPWPLEFSLLLNVVMRSCFPGECIIRVWNYGPPVQACKCPICRRLINLLVPAALSGQEDGPQAQRILGEIQHYNCIFGGAPRSLTQVGTLSMKADVLCFRVLG